LTKRLKKLACLAVLFWGIGAGLLGIANLFDFNDQHEWSNAFGTALCIAGVMIILSGMLTAGSFVKYAVTFRQFWLCVLAAARDSESYSDFIPLLEKRKIEKAGLDRELPWWVSWLILIFFILVICIMALRVAPR
jgi:hypothetical protein